MTDPRRPVQTPSVAEAASDLANELRALYQAQLPYVLQTLRRLGIAERDVPDLAHDVFVVAYRKLAEIDRTRPMRPWLFGVAYRRALDHKRRAYVSREELPGDALEGSSSAPSAEALVREGEARALVRGCLDRLPDEQRAVLVLHDVEGHTIPEIARILEAPLNTLYSRLRLARAAFNAAVAAQAGEEAP